MFVVKILLVVFGVMSLSTAKICKKSFPPGTTTPNAELMGALYISDPDPSTGYIEFWESYTTNARLVSSTVDYNSWLKREHDANEVIANLWSYIARLVVSDVQAIYGHYKVTESMGTRKPIGVIDFTALNSLFYQLWNNFDENKNTWPYTCFNSEFFRYFYYALQNFDQLVYYHDIEFVNGQIIQSKEFMSLTTISKYSNLGVDTDLRESILEYLFKPTLLNYIPSKAVSSVFYNSELAWKSITKIIEGPDSLTSFTNDWRSGYTQVEQVVTRKCLDLSGSVVATEYYCKARDVTVKLKACRILNNVTPCMYDPLFQNYFEYGRFASYDELTVLQKLFEKTGIVLTSLKDRVSAQDLTGIAKFVAEYNPYATIAANQCVRSWPKSFDCQNNIGCNGNRASLKFDCNGGFTCRINTMYRPDCLIRFLIEESRKLLLVKPSKQWTDPIVQRVKYNLMTWLSYLPMANFVTFDSNDINDVILSTQQIINDYVTRYDVAGLTTISSDFPPVTLVPLSAKNAACQTTTPIQAYIIYCTLEPLLNSVHMFLEAFKHGQTSSVRVLNPTVNYRKVIEQLQQDRVQQYINQQTQSYFNDITSQLEQNFGSLSNYFSSLADYDGQKATADIAYIDGRLETFKLQVNKLVPKVESSFSTVLKLAIGANTAELVQITVQIGVALASASNPIGKIIGDSSLLDLIDMLNQFAQAAVTTTVLVRLSENDFPQLQKQAEDIMTGFLANEKHLDNAKSLIDGIRDGTPNMDDIAVEFLEKYNAYDPQVSKSDLALYGEKFETVAETLCEAAFSGTTAVSALVEIGLATSGDCFKISSMIAELITVYEELYDFQFDLMDTLADAVRANIAHEKANEMKLIYTSGARVDQAFLQSSAVNTYLVSVMHIWKIVIEYCDVLTYTSGGAVPTKCNTAINSPSNENVIQVLGYDPVSLCHVNNEITDFHDIPTKPSGTGDKAYIDLDKLYNLEEVTFQIPNHQWLQTHGWVGSSEGEKAIYISRFELFLPPMSGTSHHTVEVTAKPSLPNYLTNGGTKYILPVDGFSCRYNENSPNCYDDFVKNPYTLCNTNPLIQLCVTSYGYVDRKVQPSIYNEWKVSVTSMPKNQVAPKPTTHFKLQVGITMCRLDLANRRRRHVEVPLPQQVSLNRNRRGTQHCCSSNQYWNGAVCTTCPSGSSQRQNGYYCQ